MKRNDTLIRINLLDKELLTPTQKRQADALTASNLPHFVTTLLKKLAEQARNIQA